jgi:hypothetical protein
MGAWRYTGDMYIGERTSDGADRTVLAAIVGLVAAAFVAADSLLVDAFGNEDVAPNLLGIAAPPLGILVLTGLYAHLTARSPGRLLDVAYAVNVAGLALVTAVDFTRTFVLQRLDDAVVEDLVAAGPTRPALFAAAFVYIGGTVVFGIALVRRRFAVPAAWLYAVTAVPSGLVVLLPDLVGAFAQALAAVAIGGLSWRLRAEARENDAGRVIVGAAA